LIQGLRENAVAIMQAELQAQFIGDPLLTPAGIASGHAPDQLS
jgi:hypothetical protein